MAHLDFKNKQILVTGGTGFIGGYLLHYLVKEGCNKIRALKRMDSSLDLVQTIKDRIEWIECDILDQPYLEDALSGVEVVFHCAAIVSFVPNEKKSMYEVNIKGTSNIVNACLFQKVEKLIHVSSVAAIGRKKNLKYITERTKWEWSRYNSRYAISKYLSEQEIWRGMAEGLKVLVVNPSVVLGSGKWKGGTQQMFKTVQNGLKYYPQGNSGFVDVRDVAKFMIALAKSDNKNERFILNEANLTFKAFFSLVAKHLGKEAPAIPVSPLMREFIWRVEAVKSLFSGKKPIITKETVRQSSLSYYYKNDKSLESFDFTYTPIQHTIRETCRHLLESRESDANHRLLPIV